MSIINYNIITQLVISYMGAALIYVCNIHIAYIIILYKLCSFKRVDTSYVYCVHCSISLIILLKYSITINNIIKCFDNLVLIYFQFTALIHVDKHL
jgi:hypothetical protein